jgi:hypothetical protein
MAELLVIYADVVADPTEHIKPKFTRRYMSICHILIRPIADDIADLNSRR